MKAYTETRYEGENLGPIDWSFNFAQFAWGNGRGGMNPDAIDPAVERLRQLTSGGDWEATTDGGWPRCGWGKVIATGMYDGWPHWRPIPSVLIMGTLGASWHPFYSVTDVRKVQ